MTLYEQIQSALDYIETNLSNQVVQEKAAKEAGMSSRSFQHYFWAVTGYSFKEYLIKRRLSTAIGRLLFSDDLILGIALECGYQNHESFTRAFKGEFNVSPKNFRQGRLSLKGVDRIRLFKEIYMGIVVKELQDILAVTFQAFSPESENKAKESLKKWLKDTGLSKDNRRVFGHNIDRSGKQENNPQNTGYKLYLSISDSEKELGKDVELIKAGKFFVTGIEGNFQDDPEGNFIRYGWERMNEMVAAKGYKLKNGGRWFEEELEPQKEGNLRLDLYVEIE